MQEAGRAVARAVLRDFEEIGGFSSKGRVLVLAGKGHNAGDAFLAAAAIVAAFPAASVDVLFAFGERVLRPLATRAYRDLAQAAGKRLAVLSPAGLTGSYDLCLDGLFGFQFHPPASREIAALIEAVNVLPIRLRAAVDLPSAGLFRADFSYATGSVKDPLLLDECAGRIRYLDLGFFRGTERGRDRVLISEILAPLAALRSPRADKRSQGHLLVLGGSRSYPGAILMTVLAALRSGAGLVTAFVPRSLAPAFAARAPEAMWVGWPETPDGGLALEGMPLLRERLPRATAIAIGPGLGREPETLALVTGIVKTARLPVLLDADALQPEIIGAAKTPLVLTPHAGEFARIAGASSKKKAGEGLQEQLRAFVRKTRATVVLKGPITRVTNGAEIYHSFFGGPVLARGGSGDLLAGLVGGLLAQTPKDPLLAACRGTVWHGAAADLLARKFGHSAVQTTQLLDFLSAALRESPDEQRVD
ncbi:MAG: carbohydrate kinase, YjeF related protein [Verrucomicrobia bacterium]|nr:carbohydrate kinase, YjeF related protein [Verrucomicrobiota bacterium]